MSLSSSQKRALKVGYFIAQAYQFSAVDKYTVWKFIGPYLSKAEACARHGSSQHKILDSFITAKKHNPARPQRRYKIFTPELKSLLETIRRTYSGKDGYAADVGICLGGARTTTYFALELRDGVDRRGPIINQLYRVRDTLDLLHAGMSGFTKSAIEEAEKPKPKYGSLVRLIDIIEAQVSE